jgi:hypothetical protein
MALQAADLGSGEASEGRDTAGPAGPTVRATLQIGERPGVEQPGAVTKLL